jgi:hypothetical protein
VLAALGEWGMPLLEQGSDHAVFRSHWLALPLRGLRDHAPERAPVTIAVHTADQPMLVRTVDGEVVVEPGTDPNADATITGPPPVVVELFLGRINSRPLRRGASYSRATPPRSRASRHSQTSTPWPDATGFALRES